MKPKKIYLVRHGESEGNVDKKVYRDVPDWKIELTQKGQEQASEAARQLDSSISRSTIMYVSPWVRTKQTAQPIRDIL